MLALEILFAVMALAALALHLATMSPGVLAVRVPAAFVVMAPCR